MCLVESAAILPSMHIRGYCALRNRNLLLICRSTLCGKQKRPWLAGMRTFCTGFNYVNLPLQSANKQIRLLRLSPQRKVDGSDNLVEGSLFRTDLINAPPYEALSYHWGKSLATKTINLDAQYVEIRENLESALDHLRLPDESRILWVDGLCINQEDIAERNAQVAMMHEIYKKATRTVAWVGDGQDDGELALEFLQWYAGRKYLMQHNIIESHVKEYALNGWEAVRKLLLRPYWRRLWVMQEIAMSSLPPLVTCGRARISWTHLVKALDQDQTAKYIHRLQSIRGATLKLIGYGGENKANRIGRHVILLLSHSAGFETSEPRDRVYALYGLFKVVGIVGFTPDYNISVGQVFQQLTEYALFMKGGLDVLELRPHDQDSDLPSWVVDLSKRPPLSFEKRDPVAWQRLQGNEQAETNSVEFTDDHQLLRVQGTVIDEISSVAPVHSCLTSAFRNASRNMGTHIFGGHSLRSDTVEASRYWTSKETLEHPDELCHNSIDYLCQWQSVISYFCKAGVRTDGWVPRSWDWRQMAKEVPSCLYAEQRSLDSDELPSDTAEQTDLEHDFETRYRASLDPLLSSLSVMLQGRACFRTARGFQGVTLLDALPGDKVVAFQSTKQLHVLRSSANSSGQYRYVGAAILCASSEDDGGRRQLGLIFDKVRDNQTQDEVFVLR